MLIKMNYIKPAYKMIWLGGIKGIQFLLCAIDVFCKYAWVFPLKEKKV